MVSWSDNDDWSAPLRSDICGYISDSFTPCERRRPCPVHDRSSRYRRPGAYPSPHKKVDPARASVPMPPMLEDE